jgi:hypothetical protein
MKLTGFLFLILNVLATFKDSSSSRFKSASIFSFSLKYNSAPVVIKNEN